MTTSGTSTEPAAFRRAVDAMHAARVREEIELGSIRPPQRLAPYSHALGAELRPRDDDADGNAFGRLILLYDPDGQDAWHGTIRLVAYIQADLDSSIAEDPMFPDAAWSWLSDALDEEKDGVGVTALGGTVTSTTSVRFGDIAGPPRAHQLEMRASWTANDPELAAHVEAFCEVLAMAAGLPPVGVSRLGNAT